MNWMAYVALGATALTALGVIIRARRSKPTPGPEKWSTNKRGQTCNEDECAMVMDELCPDCMETLYYGPQGGMSQNMYCSVCGSKFNVMGPFGVERISDASPNMEPDALLSNYN